MRVLHGSCYSEEPAQVTYAHPKSMPTCLFCLKDCSELTDEHIIPAALGGNLLLRGATCTECQRVCNNGFETRFLKGSNFISLIRSNLGIRGRGNEPIYGFDQHGAPLTVLAQSGFPPIRVGLAYRKLERPMQVILLNELRSPLEYCFLPEKIALPVGASFFSSVIETVPDGCTSAALWADGDILPVNHWRQLMEAFLSWCHASNIAALVSTAATGSAKIELSVDWNSHYRNRGLTKIALMYALYRMETSQRTANELFNVREYVLNGTSYPRTIGRTHPSISGMAPTFAPKSSAIASSPTSWRPSMSIASCTAWFSYTPWGSS